MSSTSTPDVPLVESILHPSDFTAGSVTAFHHALKAAIVQHLRSKGVSAHDLGTTTSDPVDYPDTAASAAVAVARGEADAAIVIDGAGLGSTIDDVGTSLDRARDRVA